MPGRLRVLPDELDDLLVREGVRVGVAGPVEVGVWRRGGEGAEVERVGEGRGAREAEDEPDGLDERVLVALVAEVAGRGYQVRLEVLCEGMK